MRQETATVALTFIAMYVGHQVGDHWVQTSHQAGCKGARTRKGQIACAKHVVTYTITQLVAIALLAAVADFQVSPVGLFACLTFSAVTHYAIDRRYTLAELARVLGKAQFYALGAPRENKDDNPSLGTGAYALDQSAHYACLFVGAILAGIL